MHLREGFTLIELLVVVAIIAVMAVVVVLTLNPAALLQQSRDSNRLSDMATLDSALSLYATDQNGSANFNLGSSSVVYISVPDPAATTTAGDQCQGLGLVSLPAGYSYHCAASSTFRAVNGTGWIPVDFSNISSGMPMSVLPVDPTNQTSSRLYYTYATDGDQYEVTAPMESAKYKIGGSSDVVSTDGSSLSTVYAKGTDLALEPLDYGDTALIGYWTMDEGTGTVAYDYSGGNATGSWNGGQVGTNGYYTTVAKVGAYSGAFDGTSTYASVPSISGQHYGNNFTLTAWVKTGSASIQDIATINRTVHNNEFIFLMNPNGTLTFWDYSGGYGFATSNTSLVTYPVNNNSWHFVAFVRTGTTGQYYVDGNPAGTATAAQYNTFSLTTFNISHVGDSDGTWNGLIDDVRMYSRSLSAAEIVAMYNGGK